MPSYNVSRYVENCYLSVLNQTFEDLEILAIDAGSTDGTREIIEKYSQIDSRVKMIDSKKKSYGYQINLGISEARGKYIGIVETDDFIEPDMYEKLLNVITKEQVQYVKCNAGTYRELPFGVVREYGLPSLAKDSTDYYHIVNPSVNPEYEMYDRFIWTGLYEKDFIKQIKLNESAGAAFQDIGFAFQLHSMAQRAYYIDEKLYHYRLDNQNSSSYNRNTFSYILGENDYIFDMRSKCGKDFVRYSYLKMFDQVKNRIKNMADSGCFWEDKREDFLKCWEILRDKDEQIGFSELIKDEELKIQWEIYKISPYSLFGAFLYPNEKGERRLQNFLDKLINREIVLFGTGKKSYFPRALLESRGIGRTVAFCDNSAVKDNGENELYNIPVLLPDTAFKRYPDAIFLITSMKYAEEMNTQLLSMGVKEENVIVYNLGECDFWLYNCAN